MRFTGLWWWIDRWRKSTAYTDMTLEQQGAYRNLLDEAALRGGPLPDDERVLAKACGDATRWKALREVLLARFVKRADGLRNETLDSVLAETARRSAAQRAYRARNRLDNAADNENTNASNNGLDNGAHNKPRPPDPDPDLRNLQRDRTTSN